MSLFLDRESGDNAQLFTSRVGRLESDEPAEKPTISDALFPENGDDDADDEYIEEEDTEAEPVDEDGDPTDMSDQGDHDHHQDDNYALGGHVTRSSS